MEAGINSLLKLKSGPYAKMKSLIFFADKENVDLAG